MGELRVAKFGGSSLADADQFAKVKAIVTADRRRRYIVPSAPGKRNPQDHKVTDLLYMCHQLASHGIDCGEVFSGVAERVLGIEEDLGIDAGMGAEVEKVYRQISSGADEDFVASRGEYLSGMILAKYLDVAFVDAAEVIKFDSAGRLDRKRTRKALAEMRDTHEYAVIPGFYGSDRAGQVVTFSRGGSDVTGAVVASALNADLYENWTDVSGFLKADPRLVPGAGQIPKVTYKELRELAYMGAPVLHEEAIFPVRGQAIPIHIRNTNDPADPGTLIISDSEAKGFEGVTGIAGKRDFTVISIEKTLMDDERGFLRKLVSVFETNGISISHIPSGIDSVSVIVPGEEIQFKLDKVVEELRIYLQPDTITVEDDIALLAVVGRGMVRTPGIAGRLFSGLAAADVNVRMISQGAGELSIIIGVDNADFEAAIRGAFEGA